MATRKYVLVKQSDRENSLERARSAVNTWSTDWLSNSDIKVSFSDSCNFSANQQDGQWIACEMKADLTFWAFAAAGVEDEIHTRIFELDDGARNSERRRGSLISAAIAKEALSDLISALVKFQSDTMPVSVDAIEKPPEWVFKRNSGVSFIEASIGGKALQIAIPIDKMPWRASRSSPKHRPAVTPLTSAVSNIETCLVAKLGEVEISLGQFASLSIGDVIRLPTSIEDPLTLYIGESKQLCSAYLGRQGNRRTIEIFRTKTK